MLTETSFSNSLHHLPTPEPVRRRGPACSHPQRAAELDRNLGTILRVAIILLTTRHFARRLSCARNDVEAGRLRPLLARILAARKPSYRAYIGDDYDSPEPAF